MLVHVLAPYLVYGLALYLIYGLTPHLVYGLAPYLVYGLATYFIYGLAPQLVYGLATYLVYGLATYLYSHLIGGVASIVPPAFTSHGVSSSQFRLGRSISNDSLSNWEPKSSRIELWDDKNDGIEL